MLKVAQGLYLTNRPTLLLAVFYMLSRLSSKEEVVTVCVGV